MVSKKVKICLATLALLIGLSAITPAAFATEKGSPRIEEQNIYTPTKEELKQLGLSDIEIKQLFEMKSTGITLYYGEAYNSNGDLITDGEHRVKRGKLSWAVKAIKKAWDKLPTKVKVLLGIEGFAKLLDFIDHFTGAVEDAIYEGLIALGFNKTVAWWIMKIITSIAL